MIGAFLAPILTVNGCLLDSFPLRLLIRKVPKQLQMESFMGKFQMLKLASIRALKQVTDCHKVKNHVLSII
jgi:hypothetical protein